MSDTATIDATKLAQAARSLELAQRDLPKRRFRRLRGLTYTPEAHASLFQDSILMSLYPEAAPTGAEARLRRHVKEMEVISRDREERDWSEFRAGGFEYRVEPNTTQGTGGYFAPPLWLNQFFATANRPARVLADLIPGSFPLPSGVSSINLPIISTGSVVAANPPNMGVDDQDIADSSGTSNVAVLSGDADCSIQLLEQSPPGAHIDWAFGLDLSEAYDLQVEQQLFFGQGGSGQITGAATAGNTQTITYTSGSPAQKDLWVSMSKAFAQLGDARGLPPEVWLMRSARWAWLMGGEGNDNLPFGILSPGYMGQDDDTPWPIGGLFGLPTFLDDAIPATCTFGSGGNNAQFVGGTQDLVAALRPSDMLFLEGQPQFDCFTEVLSGSLGARVQMHNSIAAVVNRRPAGIAMIGGTGMVVQSGY